MVAAAAMTSCSSYDEPAVMDGSEKPLSRAGEVVEPYDVYSEEDLVEAINSREAVIAIGESFTVENALEIPYEMTLMGESGAVLSTKQPIICKGNVTFKNLTIDAATPVGLTAAIRVSADGINVVLDNVQLTQNTPGQDDTNEKASMAINVDNYGGGSLSLINGTTLNIPSNYVRGINMYSSDNSVVNLLIENSTIHCGTDLSKPATYSRGLQFGSVKTDANKPVRIINSVIEGPYYDINITGTSQVTFDIEGSTFNGRGAFNVWASNTVATLKGCTLIGQNPYMGGWENFANVKINNGANNCTFTFNDTDFKMYRASGNPDNSQLMVMTGGTGTHLIFEGSVNVYDYSKLTTSFIGSSIDNNSIEITGLENIHLVEANPNATIL